MAVGKNETSIATRSSTTAIIGLARLIQGADTAALGCSEAPAASLGDRRDGKNTSAQGSSNGRLLALARVISAGASSECQRSAERRETQPRQAESSDASKLT